MKLTSYVMVNLIFLVGFAGFFQIPLVQDLVTATGYSSAEVFSGLFLIVFIFMTIAFGVTYRR